MSYNITGWETKELIDFKLCIDDLKKAHAELRYDMEVDFIGGNNVSIKLPDEWGEIIGNAFEGWITVTSFNMGATYSSYVYYAFEKHVFPTSKGRMKALVVWEGGDDVYYLTIDNGSIEKERL